MDLSSFEEASHLVDEPDSCLEIVRCREHIPLPPQYLGRLRTGVQEVLGSELKMYSARLKGVPVSYSNISLVQTGGNILDDQPYIHLDVETDFIVFRPKVGSTLVGKVNKLGKGHVGCLVHNYFNASIPRPRGTVNGWAGSRLAVGDKFNFTVTRIEADYGGVLAITGKILDDTCDSYTDIQPSACLTGTPGKGIIKKRKHTGDEDPSSGKKLRQTTETVSHREATVTAAEEPTTSTDDISPNKKKRHKKKHREKGHCDTDGLSVSPKAGQLSPDCEDNQDEGNTLTKKKKKHKESTKEDLPSMEEAVIERFTNTAESLPKKQKKKRQEENCFVSSAQEGKNYGEGHSGIHSKLNGDKNEETQLSVENNVLETQSTSTKKKKKKHKDKKRSCDR
ncbi:PREDICTED: DNA-directed RNA polymerase I subunit RPA43-like [Branchiostoma belcheri]|uniref:DNA-directed RNA polymerase I subunit RPA43 n=1 Tax=Branchiostoma belcheri TaxID=7741 RepID=A0A6P4Z5I0_BRABE|nr:PREDICTED: DNA-directed RNA polymerase I subunit RPA43-like [Branchiostoma belcheri]